MYNDNSQKEQISFVASLLLHGGALAAVAVAHPMMQIPEGTIEATTIEFTAMEPNKGYQTQTTITGPVSIPEKEPSRPSPEPVEKHIQSGGAHQSEAEEPVWLAKEAPKKKSAKKAAKASAEQLPSKEPTPVPAPEAQPSSPAVQVVESEDNLPEVLDKEIDPTLAQMQTDPLPEPELHATKISQLNAPAPTAPAVSDDEFTDGEDNDIEAEEQAALAAVATTKKEQTPKTQTQKPKPVAKPTTDMAQKTTTTEKNGDQGRHKSSIEESPSLGAKANNRSDLAYGVATGVQNIKDLRQVPGNRPPQYPQQARLKRQQGTTVLKYYVTPEGQVTQVRLVQSSGYPALDDEAVRAISRYRFYGGQAGETIHPVQFSLRGELKAIPTRLRQ